MTAPDSMSGYVATVEAVLTFWLTRADTLGILGGPAVRHSHRHIDALLRRFGALPAVELTSDRLLAAYRHDPATDAADLAAGTERALLYWAFETAAGAHLIPVNPLGGPAARASAALGPAAPAPDPFDGWATILSPRLCRPAGSTGTVANSGRGGYLPPRGRLAAGLARH
ncbi:hypothetical protein ACWDUL_02365 [Nocardia niigatensis]|uniref:hypothetical protein n=1 Tax=Nocardia niigatensis TaxID=209249 RepID=UPI0003114006|nr:hypothetical protein [Nocardia niigatensis]